MWQVRSGLGRSRGNLIISLLSKGTAMPKVGNMEFPYTAKGKADAKKMAKKMGKPMVKAKKKKK